MRYILCLMVLLVAADSAFAADRPRANPEAVKAVASGEKQTANAAWWGFDANDATDSLQAAIDSGAEKVLVPDMGKPWVVRPIELASDQTIQFKPGVVVEAKKGAYKAKNACLFTAINLKNLTLRGKGATFRMHKADYQSDAYEPAQWRHTLSLRGCKNVTIAGLTFAKSGGDGIYIGRGQNDGPVACRDVTIKNVKCLDNHRQGISVISARNLTIADSVLRDTAGHAPGAGIDFEPNNADEVLVDCVVSDCVIDSNAGRGIQMYLVKLDKTTRPISIEVKGNVIRDNGEQDIAVIYKKGVPKAEDDQGSLVEFKDNKIDGYILIRRRPDDRGGRFKVRFYE